MWMWAVCAIALAGVWAEWRRSGKRLLDFLAVRIARAYAQLWHRCSTNRRAPLPQKGAALLVSNHTCSADPAFIASGCERSIGFLIAQEYYQARALRWFFDFLRCVPVKRNHRDIGGVRAALRRLSEGCVLCIFPEGGLSNAGRNRIGLVKPGIALLAIRSRAPVYPAAVIGGPQTSSVLRGWLLPSCPVKVVYGPPVDLSDYYDRRINRQVLEEVTAIIMNRIAALAAEASTKGA